MVAEFLPTDCRRFAGTANYCDSGTRWCKSRTFQAHGAPRWRVKAPEISRAITIPELYLANE